MRRTPQELERLVRSGFVARSPRRQTVPLERCVRIGCRYVLLPDELPGPQTYEQAQALTRGRLDVWHSCPTWWEVVAQFEEPELPRRALRIVSGRYRDQVAFLLVPDRLTEEEVDELEYDELAQLPDTRELQYLPAGVTEIGTRRIPWNS